MHLGPAAKDIATHGFLEGTPDRKIIVHKNSNFIDKNEVLLSNRNHNQLTNSDKVIVTTTTDKKDLSDGVDVQMDIEESNKGSTIITDKEEYIRVRTLKSTARAKEELEEMQHRLREGVDR